MKSSLGKLKRFAFQKNDGKERREFQPPAKVDGLAQVFQEMQDMRDCYDGLLSAAAATASSAYEFSESLRELGACLLDKMPLCNDEESGKVLLMLGEVQFELQKLVDRYRSQIFVTITNPSESLLNELQTVEEMKRQCDEKRSVYEYMISQQKEKGRSKGGKGEAFSADQLQAAHTEYEEEATLCVFRLKSLKQGQSRSLLTQAARHHTAQLNFFRKGLKSLEFVDPHMKVITEKHHIDHLSGLEEGDNEGDGENGCDFDDDGELSFNYQQQRSGHEMVSTSRNSMELDQEDVSFPRPSTLDNSEVKPDQFQGEYPPLDSKASASSHSAPIFVEKKFDPAEKMRQMRPSLSQKFHSYVLPTPNDAKSSTTSRSSVSASRSKHTNVSGSTHKIWLSSPLDNKMQSKDSKDENLSIPVLKSDSAANERPSQEGSMLLPLPLADGRSYIHESRDNTSDSKKVKRQSSFPGPLSSRPRSSKSEPIASPDFSKLTSGSASQGSAGSHPTSLKLSSSSILSSVSPPPALSELHELPRPPSNTSSKSTRPSVPVGHSAPLTLRNPEFPVTNKNLASGSTAASLPVPPSTVPRSLSIPPSSQRAMPSTGVYESSQLMERSGEIISPPTPASVANVSAIVTTPEARAQPGNV